MSDLDEILDEVMDPVMVGHEIWQLPGKSGIITPELQSLYERFKSSRDVQRKEWKESPEHKAVLKDRKKIDEFVKEVGLELDWDTGKLKYSKSFKPLDVNAEICYVRHGQTEGNKEPRIFQGYVDYPENQLTAEGKKQAEKAADLLDGLVTSTIFTPNLLVVSPLGRARETAVAFHSRHLHIPFKINEKAAEIGFGCFDNVQLRRVQSYEPLHLFWHDHNVLVVAPKECQVEGKDQPKEPENFIQLLMRQRELLLELSGSLPGDEKVHAAVFGHSMAGAAMSILMGRGVVNSDGNLQFDGKATMPNATPIILKPTNPWQPPK